MVEAAVEKRSVLASKPVMNLAAAYRPAALMLAGEVCSGASALAGVPSLLSLGPFALSSEPLQTSPFQTPLFGRDAASTLALCARL